MMAVVEELDLVTGQSLERFVRRWYGLPDRPPLDRPLPAGLPPALVEWYRLADRYSYPLSRDHAFRPAEALVLGTPMVTFWDGQRDRYAYRDGGEDDPWVFEHAGDWTPTGLRLSRFLVYAAVYEATYAPLHGLVRMTAERAQLYEVRLRLRELDDPLWQWPDAALRYLGDDDLLAHLGTGTGGRIVIAARHRDALGRFDGLGIGWDWDSREDD